jgi:hypothetical protein
MREDERRCKTDKPDRSGVVSATIAILNFAGMPEALTEPLKESQLKQVPSAQPRKSENLHQADYLKTNYLKSYGTLYFPFSRISADG